MVDSGKVLDCRTGEWAYFDCTTTSDHRHVQVTVMLESCTVRQRKSPRVKKAKFHNDLHLADYIASVSQAVPVWQEHEAPGCYLTRAMDKMAEIVIATAPKRGPPRKPWISQRSWDHMMLLNRWRRLQAAWKRGEEDVVRLLAIQLQYTIVISCHCSLEPALCACNSSQAVMQRLAEKVLLLSRENKRNLKQDTVKRLPITCMNVAHDADGFIVNDKAKVARMWLSYWKDHFGARSAPPASFNDRSLPSSGVVATTLAEEDGNALLFSEEEVCFALKHMQKWKATADKAPAAAVIALADRLARPLCRLFNECVRSGEVPLSFAGARIVPVYKKKGP
eukprot:1584816-Amphidinium_carterae.1